MNDQILIEYIIITIAAIVVIWFVVDLLKNRKNLKKGQAHSLSSSRKTPNIAPQPHNPTHKPNKETIKPANNPSNKPIKAVKKTITNSPAHKSTQAPTVAKKPIKPLKRNPTQEEMEDKLTIDLNTIGKTTLNSTDNTRAPQRSAKKLSPHQTARQQAISDNFIRGHVSTVNPSQFEKIPDNCREEDLIVIFVKTYEQGAFFKGSNIQKLLEEHSMDHGNRDIYHQYDKDDSGKYRLVFSVANGLGDGKLGSDLSKLQTRSLVFIMQINSYKPLKYFDRLITISEDFSKRLNGRLYSNSKEIWTEQTTNKNRELIRRRMASNRQKRVAKIDN